MFATKLALLSGAGAFEVCRGAVGNNAYGVELLSRWSREDW